MNIAQPVNSKVTGVSFTFYDPSEVRRMSVKQVVNPVLLDSLGNPTKGGLYDPAMGPFTKNHLCGTCSLSYFNCPGHFGHIELPSPVVNPMMFDVLYRFLQGCCPYCHKFTFNRVTAARFVAKLRLLEYGLVKEASDLDDMLPKTQTTVTDPETGDVLMVDGNASDSGSEAEEAVERVDQETDSKGGETAEQYIGRINRFVEKKLSGGHCSTYKVTMVNNVRRQLIKELISRSRNQNCQNCRGPVPKLRRDGYLKVFREPLTRKQQAAQHAKGMVYADVLHLGAAQQQLKKQQQQQQEMNGSEASGSDSSDESESESDSADAYDKIDAHPTKPAMAGVQRSSVYLTPMHLRNHLRLLFGNEPEIVRLLFQQRDPQAVGALQALGGGMKPEFTLTTRGQARAPEELADMFFIEALPVPPTKFRPASVMDDDVMENPQNVYLGQVLKTCVYMRGLVSSDDDDSVDAQLAVAGGAGFERVVNAWVNLQQTVNNVMDSSKNPTLGKNGKLPDPGIRQVLEKKEGLFRQNMMGKRVNYAARSVISPDPNLESDEVGVPPVFAKTLTYAEPVTPHNVKNLRRLVINGPEKWPGAVSVQHEDGSLVYLSRLSHESRVALANQLLTPQDAVTRSTLGNVFTARPGGVNKKVLRHLQTGDMVVMNRQPTLHRASMAGMRAHVLPGERTLRFHYLNCNQFNSDFDGDEMNMHFPQNEVARSELRNIMGADMTYLNPTDGGPLRGLIQDSVDGGVIMTKRDTMFTRSEYQELVYWALRPETQPQLPDGKVQLLPPAIFRPRPMWTGKQVVSTLLLNLTCGYEPLNLVSKDKIGKKYLTQVAEEEERVLVLDGELLVGILDKSQFGASSYGLVHSVYELYSPTHAGRLLSTLGRLFLRYLQEIGFSCRMEDLLFDRQGDAIRKEMIKAQRSDGIDAALGFVGLDNYTTAQLDVDAAATREFHGRMEEVLRSDAKLAQLDGAIQGRMNQLTSSLISECLPARLHLPFPHNNMVVMTVSGAKGSNINLSQITCCLGQQSLEGRRVPLMVSGKSLPSFAPFDSAGRAGGYVASRFLTGLKPQEFYFHCMAGREGLIDTAVKTSRSGYLQRCLIKHLEGIQVHYDYTVRDADGSVIQFQYGEDALDVLKCQHLTQFDFAATNYRALRDKFNPTVAAAALDDTLALKYAKKLIGTPDAYDPRALTAEPISSKFNPSRFLGAVSERFYVQLEQYLAANPSGLLREKKKKSKGKNKDDVSQSTAVAAIVKKPPGNKMLASVADKAALMAAVSRECTPRNFRMLQYLNYLHSLIEPGESVGLIAAQGIGEPSTQMTLNTFHLAGFGAKNVTLGIPRLREIVMVASDNISAPIMEIPLLDGVTKEHAESISNEEPIKESDIDSDDDDNDEDADEEDARTARRAGNKAYDEPDDDDKEMLGGIDAELDELDTLAAKQTSKDKKDNDDSMDVDSEDSSDDEAVEQDIKRMRAIALSKRRRRLIAKYPHIVGYNFFDDQDQTYIEIELQFSATTPKFLMLNLAEAAVRATVVREIHGISACYVNKPEAENDTSLSIGTNGSNINGIWDASLSHLDDIANTDEETNISQWMDINRLYTNDIAGILRAYGVEAARKAIVREINSVFGTYNIEINDRHLGLVADYMTFEGGFKPFNRIGLSSSPSPFAKMSFESTCTFLQEATVFGDFDELKNPSARIVMGQPVSSGTGAFDVLVDLAVPSAA
ncbi:hypothetical protein GGF40_002722 [Coemansia sp. RSA 1286]|nr:hypothetical protein GGF40_002722 [Coemansia sp. RSA 1286]